MDFKTFEDTLHRAEYWLNVWLIAATEEERIAAHRTYEYYMGRVDWAMKEGVRE